MQLKSFIPAAAPVGGLAIGVVISSTIADTVAAQTASSSPSASASPADSNGTGDDALTATDDYAGRGRRHERAPDASTLPEASPSASTSTDM